MKYASPGRWWLLSVLLAWAAGLAPAPALAAQDDAQGLELEATHLVNFLRYTQWPQARFQSADSPFVLTVVGSEDAATRIRAVIAATGKIEGRAIDVRWLPLARGSHAAPFDSPRDLGARGLLRDSHLVFFHSSSGRVHPQVLADLARWPVLTVSDTADFTRDGGMFEFVPGKQRIGFRANPGAIRGAGLMVSAKVLKLARVDARTRP